MSIEKNLEALALNTGRIADALEKLLTTTAMTMPIAATTPPAEEPEVKKPAAKKAEPKKQAPPPEPEPEPEVEEEQAVDPLDDDQPPVQEATFTSDEVRAALRTYRDVEGDGAMMAVLKSFGATGMGSLKESDYAAVMAKVR